MKNFNKLSKKELHDIQGVSDMFKFLPELTVFTSSLIYLIIYILNDLKIYKVPSWILDVPLLYITPFLMLIIFIYREKKG